MSKRPLASYDACHWHAEIEQDGTFRIRELRAGEVRNVPGCERCRELEEGYVPRRSYELSSRGDWPDDPDERMVAVRRRVDALGWKEESR